MVDLNEFKTYYHSSKPGLYALFIKNRECLSTIFLPDFCNKIINHLDSNFCENCIYIGKETDKLYERVENKHTNGKIRNSTLRYTISFCAGMIRYGVIGTTPSKYRKLSKEDEIKITNWIKKYTYFKIIETDNYTVREKEFINKYCPPLNIDDNPKPILERSERTNNFTFINKDEFDKL